MAIVIWGAGANINSLVYYIETENIIPFPMSDE
jgi:hypothetical protein